MARFPRKIHNDGKRNVLVSTAPRRQSDATAGTGSYQVNVALGRANLTRKIVISADQPLQERFVLNAGGLRVVPVLASGEAAEKVVTFDVQSDERRPARGTHQRS